ncbi:carbohydrate porin [Bradyrhizobium sp.]|uniref:carbohydrate porin n=1 Tax=Bradyrhizobium sp. TaxID=376 RepID=UPI000A902770|nr:carbohydrate porin [Bradyrhizobium sp.]
MVDASAEPPAPPSIATGLPADGDPTGIRKWLGERGVTYGLVYTGEALGNASGGVRRGALYGGKLEGFVSANLEKLAGWRGLNFFSNAFQIHRSSGPRDQHFSSLITISNIEAASSTRLSELWLEQKFFDDRFSFRFGQLTTDAEFFISDYSRMFISSDWPTIMGANLPSGGPAYPLATPGVRWKLDPNDSWSMLLGLYNGDPGDQATVNRTGTNFRVNDPPLLMGELQHRYHQDKGSRGLAGIVRLGGWHHFGRFDDQRYDDAGFSLADPLSSGAARRFRGTSGVYGIIDQQIYRPEAGGPDSGISVFSRVSGTPSDRNLINFFLDGGVVFAGMLADRPNDKFGASVIYARISDRARALDRDLIAFSGIAQPIRAYEMTIELSYQAEIKPGWTMQPTFQYIVHPGGHVPHPVSPGVAIKSGALFGVRSTVAF